MATLQAVVQGLKTAAAVQALYATNKLWLVRDREMEVLQTKQILNGNNRPPPSARDLLQSIHDDMGEIFKKNLKRKAEEDILNPPPGSEFDGVAEGDKEYGADGGDDPDPIYGIDGMEEVREDDKRKEDEDAEEQFPDEPEVDPDQARAQAEYDAERALDVFRDITSGVGRDGRLEQMVAPPTALPGDDAPMPKTRFGNWSVQQQLEFLRPGSNFVGGIPPPQVNMPDQDPDTEIEEYDPDDEMEDWEPTMLNFPPDQSAIRLANRAPPPGRERPRSTERARPPQAKPIRSSKGWKL